MTSKESAGPVVAEVDGTADGLHVIDFATVAAQRTGSALVLVRPYRTWAGMRRVDADRELRAALGHVRRQVGYDLPVRVIAREGTRHEVLAQLSRTAALVVVPRQRVRGPQRLIAAQDDLRLATSCLSPVTVVPRSWKPDSHRTAVAVGVDGTPLSCEAVGYAFAAAEQCGARLVVIHAEAVHVAAADEVAWGNEAGLAVAETLAGWQELHPGVRVSRLLTTEPVSQALARWSARSGLLVLGVRPGRNRTVVDPVAAEALAAATCAVTLVKHQPSGREIAANGLAASRA